MRIGEVAGEELTPVAVARNIGSSASIVSGRIPYTLNDGSMGTVLLPETLLAPGEAEPIDIARAVKASGIRQNVATAGLEFEYSTEPGSVMMSALSVSRDGNQVFNVPLWDIAAQRSSTGGYPWSIDGDSSTIVYIKNVTDSPQKYTLDLDFGDGGSSGVYATGMRTVEAHQTVALDVRQLRDNQVPDTAGRTIPATATHGQIRWSMHGTKNLVLIGRVEQVDVAKGIASSYACQNCCPSTFYNGWITPGEVNLFEGESTQLTPLENTRSCYGYISAPYEVGNPFWSSSDESVAWPGYQGLVTGMGAGEAMIRASWTTDSWFMGLSNDCEYTPLDVLREAFADVIEARANRGRIQAQGRNPPVQKSRAWSQDAVPTRSEGLAWLDQVWNSLTAREKSDRQQAYEDAKRFIQNAPAGGYLAPISRTFQDPQRRDPTARIDIEVIAGSAFTTFSIGE